MGVLRDRMVEEMKLTELLSSNTGILRLRGKQTGQISPQITGSTQQGGHPGFPCASYGWNEKVITE